MLVRSLILLVLALLSGVSPASSQIRAEGASGRKATTLGALTAYAGFYHLQAVRVRAKLVTDQVGTALLSGETRLLAVGDAATAQVTGDVEVAGTFIDVGRLTHDDQRVSTYGLAALSQKVLQREWPAQGELLVIVVNEVRKAEPFTAPSVRGLALDPLRFDGQSVTVSGRFRGRNLFGDQPASPARSKFDFVIQLADASLWVVGRRPKGQGFDLNVDARVDTGRWLEVQGDVHTSKGLVWIEAIAIRTTQPVSDTTPVETTEVAPPAPPPQVIFSTPTAGEVDVTADARVRLQFSRDMTPQSFKGNVMAAYDAREAAERGIPPASTPPFVANYDQGRRTLELKFSAPFERFRTVIIRLAPGITAFDSQPLAPFELRFTVGG
ncbi:hypothetical protein LuPra_03013 [Luteitalea pratensis]|uniref:SbsA Ig-like domain-containing protein n=1 Tax=Luteitalea pratensis TaxID=1855912 RepID=A0A143PMF7_LUTPR|nr:Ig-like domain-containing protein [Luteitalea pratensis]AMY09787.1 hypothetical protein LuPra_03013 [Luteitalea pratensis]